MQRTRLTVFAAAAVALGLSAGTANAQVVFTETMGDPASNTDIVSYDAAGGFDNSATLTFDIGGAAVTTDVRDSLTSAGNYPGASGGGNVFFGTAGGDPERGFSIAGIDTTGFENLELIFGANGLTSTADVAIEWSPDGSTWNPLSYTFQPSASWGLVGPISLPAAAEDETNLQLRWIKPAGTGAQLRLDDITLREAGDDPELSNAYTTNLAGDEVFVNFLTDPADGGESNPANWSVTEDGGAVTYDVNGVAGGDPGEFILFLDSAITPDGEVTTVTFDNGVDAPASFDFYGGLHTPEILRGTVDIGGTWLSTLDGTLNVTTAGIVVDNTVDSGGGRNVTLQDGSFGVAFRGPGGFSSSVDLGDELLVVGNFGHFNGLQQLEGDLIEVVSTGNPEPAPTVLDLSTATAEDFENAESTLVTFTAEYSDADGSATFGGSAANYGLDGTDLQIRVAGPVVGELDGEIIPGGAVTITGFMGQRDTSSPQDSGYRVFPRSDEEAGVTATSVDDWSIFD